MLKIDDGHEDSEAVNRSGNWVDAEEQIEKIIRRGRREAKGSEQRGAGRSERRTALKKSKSRKEGRERAEVAPQEAMTMRDLIGKDGVG